MWFFSQKTGVIRHDDKVITAGYSGSGLGKNNPAMQNVHNVGPIPRGVYLMGSPIMQHPEIGHYAIPLHPSMDNTMYGRNGFYWHGDNPAHIGESSEGCLVSALDPRLTAWNSGDHNLTVTE